MVIFIVFRKRKGWLGLVGVGERGGGGWTRESVFYFFLICFNEIQHLQQLSSSELYLHMCQVLMCKYQDERHHLLQLSSSELSLQSLNPLQRL